MTFHDPIQVQDLMTVNPVCCTKDTPIEEVARLMRDHQCGEVPVVDLNGTKPIGVITDRDMICRTLAQGINPMGRTVEFSMSSPVHVLPITATLDDCIDVMERYQIRRVPIVDEKGELRGMVSQADLANRLDSEQIAHLMRVVSKRSQPIPRKAA